MLSESDEARGKRYVTPQEAAARLTALGVPAKDRTIRKWLRNGKITGAKVGGRVYVDWWALTEIMDKDRAGQMD